MTRLAAKTATVALVSGLALAPTAAIAAPSHCDAYSKHCTTPHHKTVIHPAVVGEKITRNTLPFTGGDIAAMSLVGAAAIGAGSAFVVAGRRRRRQPA